MNRVTGINRPWTTWEVILLRMAWHRVKIFQELFDHPTWTSDGAAIGNSTVRALRRRYLITRTRNNGRGKITWSLTSAGRALAKSLA